ncbi:hypothetical protein B0H94_11066 [Salsuginibacillus halophilus]|uniref:Uncharacterized protein n=1 Tax=Salsuginibacillus halophilus TaxID=517424 RepID=A0A2P8HBI7_9BACI|nr:hypothetical protein [Salsuginibacillus halophilus]PSL43590.1 hypothetical protein B0H94_11066 [Salsuginibacillus halophilus]
MTVSEQKQIVQMQQKIEEMNAELQRLESRSRNEFESLETDSFLNEMYN